MSSHYQEFRRTDPAIISQVVEQSPFATITANGPDWPVVAQSPVVMPTPDHVEFHLANINPAMPQLREGTPAVLVFQGPSAHVSPSWYRARFPGPDADRSRTAPTWDYLTLTLRGRLQIMEDAELTRHLEELVARHEGEQGWKLSEIDPAFFSGLRQHITGYRLGIEAFDCIAKLSQDQSVEDREWIVAGLSARATGQDLALADMISSLEMRSNQAV